MISSQRRGRCRGKERNKAGAQRPGGEGEGGAAQGEAGEHMAEPHRFTAGRVAAGGPAGQPAAPEYQEQDAGLADEQDKQRPHPEQQQAFHP